MRTKLIVTMALSAITIASAVYAKEPKNLASIKESLIKYHDSGEYQKDQAKTIDQAMQYLKTRLDSEKKSNDHKKLAIVLDIDETSLSNYPDMLAMSFGGTPHDIEDRIAVGKDPVIAPTLELYRYAKANKVAVFFITGRTEPLRVSTEHNLATAGFLNWDGLTLRPVDYHEKTISVYKTKAREDVEKQGYDIVLNIGDQQSDLAGKHADKTFKLPNPYYFLP